MCPCCGAPPDVLTMAEVQRVLRVGRTKLYELSSEWRDSGGKSGLRVLEFGNALRVPRIAVEELIGGPIHVPPAPVAREAPAAPAARPAPLSVVTDLPAATDEPAATDQSASTNPAPRRRPSRRPRNVPASQLDLFNPPAAS